MPARIHYIKQILEWADAHFERTGEWPEADSGHVWETANEKWGNIDFCLRDGFRGLRRGNSLARLLAKRRGKRNRKALPKYKIREILKWADAHHERTGRWPIKSAGAIKDAAGETWSAVDSALHAGIRGLRGGTTLAQLLQDKRHVPNRLAPSRLTIRQILAWADAHHKTTKYWPTHKSGTVIGAPGETWTGINHALARGVRGLRGSTTLAAVLLKHRRVDRFTRRRRLSTSQILEWADAHFARTGEWPHLKSGHITEAPRETWRGVHFALLNGTHGLRGSQTLAHFVATNRNLRTKANLSQFTEQQIAAWVKAFHNQQGFWPNRMSGLIPETAGDTWRIVDAALKLGCRGLKRGSSLSKFIRKTFDIRARRLDSRSRNESPSSE